MEPLILVRNKLAEVRRGMKEIKKNIAILNFKHFFFLVTATNLKFSCHQTFVSDKRINYQLMYIHFDF